MADAEYYRLDRYRAELDVEMEMLQRLAWFVLHADHVLTSLNDSEPTSSES